MPNRVAPARRSLAASLAVLALAVAVAAVIKRPPADFETVPPLVVVRDRQQHPLWVIRVAAAAHLIAVDAIGAPPPPNGHAYQLWLTRPNGPGSLGLLPTAGRKIIPEAPAIIAGLDAGRGELTVTLEPARGSAAAGPSGPVMFRAPLPAALAASPSRTGCATVACMSRSHQIIAGGSRPARIFRTLPCAGTIAGGRR